VVNDTVDGRRLPSAICVEPYPAQTRLRPVHYQLELATGELTAGVGACAMRNGWLFGSVRAGGKDRRGAVAFFRFGNVLHLSVAGRVLPIDDKSTRVTHDRGMVFSRFTVTSGESQVAEHQYVTPWWRVLTDDGMFPERRFPLAVLTSICRDPARVGRMLEQLIEPS
jgi:hypothetical protein